MRPLFHASKLLALPFLLLGILLLVDRSHQSSSSDQLARVKYLRELIAQAQSELAQLNAPADRSVQVLERAPFGIRRAQAALTNANPMKGRKPTDLKMRRWFATIKADLNQQLALKATAVDRDSHKYSVDVMSLQTMHSSPLIEGVDQEHEVWFNVVDKSRGGKTIWKCMGQVASNPASQASKSKSIFGRFKSRPAPFRLVKGNCMGLTDQPLMDPSEVRLIK